MAEENLVSVEKDGRILSGVGAEESDLTATMERRAPSGTAMADDGDAPAAPTPGSRGPKRLDKRLGTLTWEREEERRRADAAEQRAKDLEAQLEQARKPAAPTPPAAPAPPVPPQAPPPQEHPAAVSAKFTSFPEWAAAHPQATFDDYLDERQAHNVTGYVKQSDLDALIRKGIESDRETRTRYEREGEEIRRGRAVYGPDFDRVVSAPHLMTNNWPMYLVDAINSQEEPEHIKFALGSDPQLAEMIRTMNPVFAGAELAKLSRRSVAVAPTAPTARTVASPPPAPMQPVAGGGKTTTTSSADLASRSTDYDFDRSGYREARARERGVHRRR